MITRDGGSGLGRWMQGRMDAYGIPRKVVSEKSGVHEASLSRFFNNIKDLSDEQKILVAEAIGEAKAEKHIRQTAKGLI